jgi:SAM-dependent methyltransferase
VIDDMSMGIRDPYNVVLAAIKPPARVQHQKLISSAKTTIHKANPMNANVNSICSSVKSLHDLWRNIEGGYPYNYQNLTQSKAEVMLRALKYTSGQRVLEMGCNSGLYTLIMSNYASSVDAIDIDGPSILRAKAGFDFARSNGWCADNINFECAGVIEFINDHADYDCFVASLALYYLNDDAVVKLRDYIRNHISRIIVQCRPARKKLVENNPQYGRVTYTSLYNGLYDLSDNLNFLQDCGFKEVLVYGMGEIENDSCPALIADKNGLFD